MSPGTLALHTLITRARLTLKLGQVLRQAEAGQECVNLLNAPLEDVQL